jgi:sugar phosphate permease
MGIASLMALNVPSISRLATVFSLAGIYIAVQDALEGAIPADMVPSQSRGTAYGLIGTVNGIGDLGASVLVGTLWTVISPAVAFESAGALMLLGALLIMWNRKRPLRG